MLLKVKLISIFVIISSLSCHNNNKKKIIIFRFGDKKSNNVMLGLKLDNKIIGSCNMTVNSYNNYYELRKKSAVNANFSLCETDKINFPYGNNLVQQNSQLDTHTYNSALRIIYKNNIKLSCNEIENLLLESNILFDSKIQFSKNKNIDVFFYPDNEKSENKLNALLVRHSKMSKENGGCNEYNRWWVCYNFIVLRTIAYIKANPNEMKFIISSWNQVDNKFIGYKLDNKGFLIRLELLNPACIFGYSIYR